MLYASETWVLTSQAKNKVKAAQTKTERSTLNFRTGIEKQDTSIENEITEGHLTVPLGNLAKRKDLEEDRPTHMTLGLHKDDDDAP